MKTGLVAGWIAITLGYAYLRTPADPWIQFVRAMTYGGFSLWIGYALRKSSM
jgi:hypothetical protein